jgi:hypothetical protein
MRLRATFLTVTAIAAIGVALVALAFSQSEPTYKGANIHEWLKRESPQTRQALLILGTNNLSLLTRRLAYDSTRDKKLGLYLTIHHHFPVGSLVYRFLSKWAFRDMALADEAQTVLEKLGPAASPAVPELVRIAKESGNNPASRAVSVLAAVGEQGWTELISFTEQQNSDLAIPALLRLAAHTNVLAVRQGLTNALGSTNTTISEQARNILSGRAGKFD